MVSNTLVQEMKMQPEGMKQRQFAYSDVFRHSALEMLAFDGQTGRVRPDIPAAIATVCKNESNCTVFLRDGTWFTTWSQGSWEHAPDERIVYAVSHDVGRTWSAPTTIVGSSVTERVAYGSPFVVPNTDRIYLFFFAGSQKGVGDELDYDSGNVYFVFSDDGGAHWSSRSRIDLPDRDGNIFRGRLHGWLNHSAQIMTTGEVILPVTHRTHVSLRCRTWMLEPAEASVIFCENILTERDPAALRFSLLPPGPRGIRVDVLRHGRNQALCRLLDVFDGSVEDSGFNFQEMTVISLSDARWVGVGRTFLGAVGYTVSTDRGHSWSCVEPLRYRPDGEIIKHPMTMCPIAGTIDNRYVLLFTNNDGTQRGALHVWDGNGRTRNPQWMTVGREVPGERRNAGLIFGDPMVLAKVDDSGETNLKTGISMPQFIEREGRFFVCYNVNKEHILLDEIPAALMDDLTPDISVEKTEPAESGDA